MKQQPTPIAAVVAGLVAQWRADAERMAALKATAPADVIFLHCATDLEEAARKADEELLTLEQASTESGYSTRALRTKLAAGEIPQHGRKNAPRLRRGDLPRKTTAKPTAKDGGYDPRLDALQLSRRA